MQGSTARVLCRCIAPRRLVPLRTVTDRPWKQYGSRRWQSQAAARRTDAYPDQSTTPSREVDPSKTAASSLQGTLDVSDTDQPIQQFRQQLRDHEQRNTIIQKDGLSGTRILDQGFVFDNTSNLSSSILDLVDRRLYSTPNHPICITRKLIESVFGGPDFVNHIASNPVVTTHDNFDVLGFPADHPGRSRTDTYYVDSKHVLRTHTSAHQHIAFADLQDRNAKGYTICADVFRRDSIDRSHFPVFHQMECARMWKRADSTDRRKTENRYLDEKERLKQIIQDTEKCPGNDLEIDDQAGWHNPKTNPVQPEHDEEAVYYMSIHLKRSLEKLIDTIFTAAQRAGVGNTKPGEKLKARWIEAYFPFTSPSWELEVYWQGEWLELLGSGIVKQDILRNAGLESHIGWAWGLGIERLAMLLFGIPDIRLFWSNDDRFLNQFKAGTIQKFEPFSKYPACYKDIAFWIASSPASASPIKAESDAGVAAAAGGDAKKASPSEVQPAAFHENDVMEIVRDVAGSLAEDVKLVDEFVHPTTGRKSLCYRVNYRSLERTLTNEEVNAMHDEVAARLAAELDVELR